MIIKQFYALMLFYIRGYLIRKPISFLNLFGQTLGIIFILSIVGGPEYIPHAISGSLVVISVGCGLGQYAPDISALYTSKFKDIYVSSNVRSGVFMLASAMGITFIYILEAFILIAILWFIQSLSILQVLWLIIIFFSSWVLFISFGFYLALRLKYVVNIMKISGLFMLLLSYFSPVYYPETYIGLPYRYILYFSPTTHISALYNQILYGNTANLNSHILLFLFFIFLTLYLSLFRASWTE